MTLRRSIASRVTPALLFLALLVAGPSVASAKAAPKTDRAAAEEAYAAAVAAYEAQRYREAADAFEVAYAHMPDKALLWNIGRAWEKAGELQNARDRYAEFLTHKDVDEDLREKAIEALLRVGIRMQARDAANTSEARAALLRQEIAEAESDGNVELRARLQRELDELQPGPDVQEAAKPVESAPVTEDAAKPAEPEPASSAPVAAEPAPVVAEATTTTAGTLVAAHEVETTPPSAGGWASLALGVAAAAAGIGIFVHADGQRSDVRKALSRLASGNDPGMSRGRALRLEDAADTQAVVGIASAAVGGALTITGIIILAVTGGDPIEQAWRFGVQPGIDGASVSAAGSF